MWIPFIAELRTPQIYFIIFFLLAFVNGMKEEFLSVYFAVQSL